jgi:hypothetical protein
MRDSNASGHKGTRSFGKSGPESQDQTGMTLIWRVSHTGHIRQIPLTMKAEKLFTIAAG